MARQIKRSMDLIKKGVQSPQLVLPFLNRKYINIKHNIQYRNFSNQKNLIHDFIQQDSFALIILDSCRFDYFEDEFQDYFSGDLEKIYTPATATMEYTRQTWVDQYDITYVTAMPAPTDHAFRRKGRKYRPSQHITDFVHVWQNTDNKELGAVPPEVMTEQALKYGGERMVVHYAQPHAPYIGDERLRNEEHDEWGESLQDIYTKIGRYNVQEKKISDEELRNAYASNLRRVLSAVEKLVKNLSRPVVITADHGELLGEDGRYIHGGLPHPLLCEVPWFTVDEMVIEAKDQNVSESETKPETMISEQDVEKQLKDLGYL